MSVRIVPQCRRRCRSLGHHAEAVTVEVGVDRRLVEVDHPVSTGASVEFTVEEHHVSIAATDPEALGRLR
jgi:hypothetical protein